MPKWLPKLSKNAPVELPRDFKRRQNPTFSPKGRFGNHWLDLVLFGRRFGFIFMDFGYIFVHLFMVFAIIFGCILA